MHIIHDVMMESMIMSIWRKLDKIYFPELYTVEKRVYLFVQLENVLKNMFYS